MSREADPVKERDKNRSGKAAGPRFWPAAVSRLGWRPLLQDGLMLLPAFAILAVFHIWASAFNVGMSFTNWNLGGAQIVGLDNYSRLFRAPEFASALTATAWFVVGSVPTTIILALPLTYLLHFTLKRVRLYRAIVFLPYVVPTVATSLLWDLMFSASPSGLANALLGGLHLTQQKWLLEPAGTFQLIATLAGIHLPAWASGPSLAMVVVISARMWQMLGFSVVVLLAGFTTLNDEVIEAARIDGANEIQILIRVVMPMLSPTIFFLSIISVIFAVREFNTLYVMTNGGPADTTQTLTLLMFRQFYEQNHLGYGATTASVLLVLMLAVTWIQFRLGERFVSYQ